ncbi:hypothetical protein D3C72_1297950 [compost metagenome]
MPGGRGHFGHDGPGCREYIELFQGRQAQPQGIGPEAIVACVGVLQHHAHLLKTHQVVVDVGDGQFTGVRDFLQGQRAAGLADHVQDPESHLDRLDAPARRGRRLFRVLFNLAGGPCHYCLHCVSGGSVAAALRGSGRLAGVVSPGFP